MRTPRLVRRFILAVLGACQQAVWSLSCRFLQTKSKSLVRHAAGLGSSAGADPQLQQAHDMGCGAERNWRWRALPSLERDQANVFYRVCLH